MGIVHFTPFSARRVRVTDRKRRRMEWFRTSRGPCPKRRRRRRRRGRRSLPGSLTGTSKRSTGRTGNENAPTPASHSITGTLKLLMKKNWRPPIEALTLNCAPASFFTSSSSFFFFLQGKQSSGGRGLQGHAGDQLHEDNLQPGGGDEEAAPAEVGETHAGVHEQRREARLRYWNSARTPLKKIRRDWPVENFPVMKKLFFSPLIFLYWVLLLFFDVSYMCWSHHVK